MTRNGENQGEQELTQRDRSLPNVRNDVPVVRAIYSILITHAAFTVSAAVS